MLDGKPIETASRIGFVQVDRAEDDQGKQLFLCRAKLGGSVVHGGFVNTSTAHFIMDNVRPMKVDLKLERPSEEANSLGVLEGSLKLVTGGQPEVVLVRNVKDIALGTAIEKEILQSEGVTLKLNNVEPKWLAIDMQGPMLFWSINLVDGEGKIVDAEPEITMFGPYYSLGFKSEAPFPAEVGLRMVLLSGQQEETLPFSFRDIPLPNEDGEQNAETTLGPSDSELREMVKPINDKAVFIGDLLGLFERVEAGEPVPVNFEGGRLEDLDLEGDTAVAVEVTKHGSKEEREPIEFQEIEGRWYMNIEGRWDDCD